MTLKEKNTAHTMQKVRNDMTKGDFLAAYNIGHRDGKEDVYCPNDYDEFFNIKQQPSENEQIIRISKGTLKARTGRYVIYDVEWLKAHFNTTEAKIYGKSQPVKCTEERTEMHECDLEQIIKSTIKEYIDKDCDDVTELLLALSKDLCERIRKERENGL